MKRNVWHRTENRVMKRSIVGNMGYCYWVSGTKGVNRGREGKVVVAVVVAVVVSVVVTAVSLVMPIIEMLKSNMFSLIYEVSLSGSVCLYVLHYSY
jgi:hypothetical protein